MDDGLPGLWKKLPVKELNRYFMTMPCNFIKWPEQDFRRTALLFMVNLSEQVLPLN